MCSPQAEWVPCCQAGAGLGAPLRDTVPRLLHSGSTSTIPSLSCTCFGSHKPHASAWGLTPSPSQAQRWQQSPALPVWPSLGAHATALCA